MGITYYKNLHSNPHFSLSNFKPLITRSVKEGVSYIVRDIELGGVYYTISFDPCTLYITIEWTEDGKKYSRPIQIHRDKSNLPSRSGCSVYYFICPHTGLKCRKLYRIGNFFWSRRAFNAIYPNQNESHLNRRISYREEPYRKYGKEFYKGKITPYGKQCRRYELHEIDLVKALKNTFINLNL